MCKSFQAVDSQYKGQQQKLATAFTISHIAQAAVLVVSLLTNAGGITAVHAQNTTVTAEKQFEVASGNLATALAGFAADAGVNISVPPELTKDKRTKGVSGYHTVQDALVRLLTGTGLVAEQTSDGGYILREESSHTLETVRVNGVSDALDTFEVIEVRAQALGGSVGVAPVATQSYGANKTETPIVEIPQSVSVVTRQQMDEMGARSVEDSVGYLAGVDTGANGRDSRVDEIWVRGYRTGSFANYMYVDGLRPPGSSSGAAALSTRFDSYGLEQVEVLKGPSSSLYGQVAPGGLINIRSKRPPQEHKYQVGLQTDTDGLIRANVDFGGPIDEDKKWLYRLVSSASHTGTQVDYVELNRFFLNPSLTWQPSTRTSITMLVNYQQDRGGSDYQFLPGTGIIVPSPYGELPRGRFLGEPDFNRYDRNQSAIGYSLEQFIGESAKLRQNVRYIEVDMNTEGAGRRTISADGRTVTGSASAYENHSKGFSADTNLLYALELGAVSHMLLAGFDYHKTDIDLASASGTVGPLDIFEPVYGSPIVIGELKPNSQNGRIQQGIYLQDQVFWNEWTLTAGLRHDRAKTMTKSLTSGSRTDTSVDATTGRIGLNYLFANGIAPYASYSTSFVPSSGEDYFGKPFDPVTGKQVELGIKYQPPGSRSLISAAVYEITQSNVLTTDLDETHICNGGSCQVQSGENRVRGFELEGAYEVSKALRVNGSFTYLDGKITEVNNANKGNRMARSPQHMAALRFNYRIAAGLDVGMGARYTGTSYGNDANTVKNSARTLVDASLRYNLQHLDERLQGMRLNLNISNLFNKDYVTCTGPTGSCFYHPNRVISAGLTYDW